MPPAPDGRGRWTLQLLADRLVELRVDAVSDETVRRTLKNDLKPWLKQQWVIDAWRTHVRPKRDVRREVSWPSHPSIDLGLRTDQTGVREAAIREEQAALLRAALDRLKDADREVVLLRGYDDLSFRKIAAVLGVGENTATVRYVRAL